MDKIWDR